MAGHGPSQCPGSSDRLLPLANRLDRNGEAHVVTHHREIFAEPEVRTLQAGGEIPSANEALKHHDRDLLTDEPLRGEMDRLGDTFDRQVALEFCRHAI